MVLSNLQMTGIVALLSLLFSPGLLLTLPAFPEDKECMIPFICFFSKETNYAAIIVHAFVIALLFFGVITLSSYVNPGSVNPGSVSPEPIADDKDDESK